MSVKNQPIYARFCAIFKRFQIRSPGVIYKVLMFTGNIWFGTTALAIRGEILII
jgi:hypothetical protein